MWLISSFLSVQLRLIFLKAGVKRKELRCQKAPTRLQVRKCLCCDVLTVLEHLGLQHELTYSSRRPVLTLCPWHQHAV